MLTATLLLSLLAPVQDHVLEPAAPQADDPAPRVLRGSDGAFVRFTPHQDQDQDRAWMGVQIDVAQEPGRPGLGVAVVVQDSPAGRAGLQAGDRLLALDGRRLQSYEDLVGRLGKTEPGQEVRLTLRRELAVPLDRRGWGDDGGPRLGVSLSERQGDAGPALVVTQVQEGWPAAAAGVRVGDRLVAANGRELASFDRLQDLLAGVEPGRELGLTVERSLELTLGTYPETLDSAPGQGWFFEVPDVPAPPEGVPQPPQGRFRVWPTPIPDPEARPRTAELQALREELRSLHGELRVLREELTALRAELAELRRGRLR